MTAIRLILPLALLALGGASAPGAAEFRVRDFGARGDGVADDGPAIQRAIAAATAAATAATSAGAANSSEPARIVFENAKYRIGERADNWHYFVLTGARDLLFEGHGAELLFHRHNHYFEFTDCARVTLRGLTFDYPEPPFVQGRIVAVDRAAASFDVELEAGYPLPPEGREMKEHRGGGHALVIEPDAFARRRDLPVSYLQFESIAHKSGRVFTFGLLGNHKQAATGLRVGDRLVYNQQFTHLPADKREAKRGYSESAFTVIGGESIVFEDVNIYATVGKAFRVNDCSGAFVLRDSCIRVRPGSGRLLACGSDGLHCKNNRGPIVIERNYLEAFNDDTINISTMAQRIRAVKDSRRMTLASSEIVTYSFSLLPGDELQFVSIRGPRKGSVLGVARVVSSSPPGRARAHEIGLDRAIEGVGDGSGAVAFNLSQTARGTAIRGNTFRPLFRQTMLARLVEATVEDNVVDSIGGLGFSLTWGGLAETGPLEGVSRPHHVVFRNNTVRNAWSWAFRVNGGVLNLDDPWNSAIVFERNRVEQRAADATPIVIQNARNVRLIDTDVRLPSDQAYRQPPVTFEGCAGIVVDCLTAAGGPGAPAAARAVKCDMTSAVLRNIVTASPARKPCLVE